MPSFFDRLSHAVKLNNSLLCVGLDPRPALIRNGDMLAFGERIVEDTAELVCAYKPNIAFYEAQGIEGLEVLGKTIQHIRRETGIPVILDAKRGDIGSTAEAYAKAVFEIWQADAVTVNPYLGYDSLLPFTAYADKATFVLCHTSNPGATDFQELSVGNNQLYETVAQRVTEWDTAGNLGLVVGATYPEDLGAVRCIAPDMWLLVPGIGAQGGNLEATLRHGLRADGLGVIINSSRAITLAESPRAAAATLRDRINDFRSHLPGKSQILDHKRSLAVGLFDLGCVQFGEFTLASGQPSPIYVDLRLLVSDLSVLRLAARAYAKVLRCLQFSRLAAIPLGGLPIGTAVALETGRPLIYPRKEVKGYGTRRAVEGDFKSGERVVVLDDLISSGESKFAAIEPLEAAGLKVHDIVVLLDREQGGREGLAERGYDLHSVLTMKELLDALYQENRITYEQKDQVQSFLQQG